MHSKELKPGIASICASSSAGFLELTTFHPLDTLTKRLIFHRGTLSNSFKERLSQVNQVIFREHYQSSLFRKYLSLFRGFNYAILYKVSQRTYQFGGHPFVIQYLKEHHQPTFSSLFGERKTNLSIYAFGGAIIGIGEVLLLPLDLLKVRGQTGEPHRPALSSLVQHFGKNGGMTSSLKILYRGASWTAFRNSIGCFALFGASALVKDTIFKLEDYTHASLTQDLVSSIVGACSSVLVAAPMDVIKVRVQAAPLNASISGISILKSLLAKEGVSALFKGVLPKLLVSGPKVAFGFTVAQQLSQFYSFIFDKK